MKKEPFKYSTPLQREDKRQKLGQPFKSIGLTLQIHRVNPSNITPRPISYLIYILIINDIRVRWDKWRN